MKIVIIGAGAIGSLFGAYLSKNNDVLLIGRKPHVNSINQKGLKIEGKTKMNIKIKATESIDEIYSPIQMIIDNEKRSDRVFCHNGNSSLLI